MEIYKNRDRSDLNIRWHEKPSRKFHNKFTWYFDKEFVAKAIAAERCGDKRHETPNNPRFRLNTFICVCSLKKRVKLPKTLAARELAIHTQKLNLYRLYNHLKYGLDSLYYVKELSCIRKFGFIRFFLKSVIYIINQSKESVLIMIRIYPHNRAS